MPYLSFHPHQGADPQHEMLFKAAAAAALAAPLELLLRCRTCKPLGLYGFSQGAQGHLQVIWGACGHCPQGSMALRTGLESSWGAGGHR